MYFHHPLLWVAPSSWVVLVVLRKGRRLPFGAIRPSTSLGVRVLLGSGRRRLGWIYLHDGQLTGLDMPENPVMAPNLNQLVDLGGIHCFL